MEKNTTALPKDFIGRIENLERQLAALKEELAAFQAASAAETPAENPAEASAEAVDIDIDIIDIPDIPDVPVAPELPDMPAVEVEIPLPEPEDLPAEGMTIAFLTDLHVDHTVKPGKIARLAERVNALKPHLIALGGDLMDGSPARCGKALAELDKLEAPLGVFGVPGNHEFYSGLEPWLDFFRRSKVRLLFNESVLLPNGVYLAGTGDKAAEHFFDDPERQDLYGENVPKALAGIPKGRCTVLLAHRPKTALNSAGTGVVLQISGHTHGGMVLGLDLLVALFNGGWVSGRYEAQGMTLLVSNGTWLWRGFPLRLGRPGEILLITLKRP